MPECGYRETRRPTVPGVLRGTLLGEGTLPAYQDIEEGLTLWGDGLGTMPGAGDSMELQANRQS